MLHCDGFLHNKCALYWLYLILVGLICNKNGFVRNFMVEMYWSSSKAPSTAQKIKHQVYRPLVSLFWAGWEAGMVLLKAASLNMFGKWDGASGCHGDGRWITAIGFFCHEVLNEVRKLQRTESYRDECLLGSGWYTVGCNSVNPVYQFHADTKQLCCLNAYRPHKAACKSKEATSTASIFINHGDNECCARSAPLGIAFGVAVVNVAIVVKAGGLWIGEEIFDDAAFDAVFARLPKLAREQIAVVV